MSDPNSKTRVCVTPTQKTLDGTGTKNKRKDWKINRRREERRKENEIRVQRTFPTQSRTHG